MASSSQTSPARRLARGRRPDGRLRLHLGFTTLGIALLLAAGMPFGDARNLAYLLAFLVFLAAFCWAFAAACLWRAGRCLPAAARC